MTSNEIKMLLMKKGIKQADIAKKYNVTRALVSALINGSYFKQCKNLRYYTKTNQVVNEISRVLGRPINEIWPNINRPNIKTYSI